MLPFLQDKDGVMAQGEVEGSDYGSLDAIADDMLSALESKDKDLLKSALESLCEYVKEEDVAQDNSLNNKE